MNLERIQKEGTKMMMQFAIPCVIAMILTSAITLVDGYFIGNYVGKEGTAAVNLGLPLLYFYLVSTVVGTVSFAVMLFGRNGYSQFFIRNTEIQQMISGGILIFSGSFILVGFNTMASFYYTSIGFAKESAVISMARGLVILLIALLVLPQFLGMTGVWLVAPVTEGLTVIICLRYYAKRLDLAI